MKNCFIDIHGHLECIKDIDHAIKRARNNDVRIILTCGTDVNTNRKTLELADRFDEVKACLGIYPINALKMSEKEIDNEIEFIRKNKDRLVGIGEVGMDFKEDLEHWERQEEIFRKFIKLSIELDNPIIIHSRKAEKECIEILEEMNAKKVIMHCFCGNKKIEERITKNGWFLTIPTSVTRSQQFQERAKNCSIEQLFCETDTPFLHPDKNGDNEPVLVVRAYEEIAKLKGIKLEEVKNKIFKNYVNLFN